MSGSKILTDIAVDDPVVLRANYMLDTSDRRYIDQQILGCETHLVQSLLSGLVASWWILDNSSDALVTGDCFCACPSDGTGRKVTKAYNAALSIAGRVTGIALAPCPAGGLVRGAMQGILAQSVTSLAALAGAVRCNTTTARPERVGALGAGDYPLGYVDNAGNLSLGPAFAVSAMTGFPAPTTPGDDYKVAYAYGGVLTYATSVKTDGSYLSIGGTVSATGDLRVGSPFTLKGIAGGSDARLIGVAGSNVDVGDDNYASIIVRSSGSILFYSGGVHQGRIGTAGLIVAPGNATTSSTGTIRLTANASLYGKNSSSANTHLLSISGDQVALGDAVNATHVLVRASTQLLGYVGSNQEFEVGAGYVAFTPSGATPAASGTLRCGGTPTLAAKISGTDYAWVFGATTLSLPGIAGDYFVEPAARTSAGAGTSTTFAGGQANGTSDPGGIGKFCSGDPDASGTQPPGNYLYGCGKSWAAGHDKGFVGIIEPPEVGVTNARSFEFQKRSRYTSVGTSEVVAWSIARLDLVPPPALVSGGYCVLKYKLIILSWLGSGTSQTGVYWRHGMIKVWYSTGTPTLAVTQAAVDPALTNPATLGCGLYESGNPPSVSVNGDALEIKITPKYDTGIIYDLILQCEGFYVPHW